ncbi:MAG: amidohydrolase family protein [Planctomycetes bacterium]|nr:amidohydrolase family protein [Planctomycetota bacterium]
MNVLAARSAVLSISTAFALVANAASQDRAAPPPPPKPLVLKVGTIHTVAGKPIRNGVIVIRGGRIQRIGAVGAVRLPRNAEVVDYPDGHAYPGLVDALSGAFSGARESADASVHAGTDFRDALDGTDHASRELVRFGITTAYSGNRSTATWRGLGAVVRPHADGFVPFPGRPHGGLGLRMTTGPSGGHALDRLKRFDATGSVFDGLEDYEKKQKDYAKAVADYDKQWKAYLAFHEKKKAAATGAKPAAAGPAPTGTQPTGTGSTPARGTPANAGNGGASTGREGTGRSGTGRTGTGRTGTGRTGNGRTGRTGEGGDPAGRRTGRPGDPSNGARRGFGRMGRGGAGAPTRPGTTGGDKGPTRPKMPARVAPDPGKEALLQVTRGKLPLRIEVHREDEIRAALFMAVTKELTGIVLEHASEAGGMAKELAEAGTPVVVTDLLPGSASYEKARDGSLPAKLHAAGVPVAIGSGSVANARNLTLMAAHAVGQGLPEDVAVRAVTLTAAEVLGVADRVGSLEKNKLADIVITSGPLLRSESKILRVLSRGTTQFDAAQPAERTNR